MLPSTKDLSQQRASFSAYRRIFFVRPAARRAGFAPKAFAPQNARLPCSAPTVGRSACSRAVTARRDRAPCSRAVTARRDRAPCSRVVIAHRLRGLGAPRLPPRAVPSTVAAHAPRGWHLGGKQRRPNGQKIWGERIAQPKESQSVLRAVGEARKWAPPLLGRRSRLGGGGACRGLSVSVRRTGCGAWIQARLAAARDRAP
jgi:hypothetical protein